MSRGSLFRSPVLIIVACSGGCLSVEGLEPLGVTGNVTTDAGVAASGGTGGTGGTPGVRPGGAGSSGSPGITGGSSGPPPAGGQIGSTSPDGATTPSTDAGAPGMARDAAPEAAAASGFRGGPAFVGVGYQGRRIVSRDGVTWTGDMSDGTGMVSDPRRFRDIAYAEGLVVAVGGGCEGACTGRIATFDGERWMDATLPAGLSWLAAVAYGNGTWVAAGVDGAVALSSDGRRWTRGRQNLPSTVRDIAFGNVGGTAMFVAAGDGFLRARSLDGQTWIDLVNSFPGADEPQDLLAVAIGAGVAIVAGEGGRRIRSRDGASWIDAAAGGTLIGSLVYADGRFQGFTDNGIVHVSMDDGRTWTPQTMISGPGAYVASGTIGGSRLFVGSTGAVIKSSPSGLVWTTRYAQGDQTTPFSRFTFAGP